VLAHLDIRQASLAGRKRPGILGGLWLVVAAAVTTTGCTATDNRFAAWDYLSPALFQPNCATVSCHSRAAAVSGLDFSDPDRGYRSLTGLPIWIVDPNGTDAQGCRRIDSDNGPTVVCERPQRPLVVAYDPSSSRVINMMRARGATRMPPDRALPEADIQLVERWILDGARRTPDGPPAPTDPYAPDSGSDASDGGAGARRDGAGRDGSGQGGGDSSAAVDGRADGGVDGPADASTGGGADAPADTKAGDGGGQ